jgi:hypothetical protein
VTSRISKTGTDIQLSSMTTLLSAFSHQLSAERRSCYPAILMGEAWSVLGATTPYPIPL